MTTGLIPVVPPPPPPASVGRGDAAPAPEPVVSTPDPGTPATTIAAPPSTAPATTSPTITAPVTTVPTTTAPVTTVPTTTTTTTTVPAPVRSWALQREPATYNGCQLAPRDHVWHSVTDGLPIHRESDRWISQIGRNTRLKVGFGALVWEGSRAGIPITKTDSRTVPGKWFLLAPDYMWMSEAGPYHVPANARYEGDPGLAWDQHLLLVDSATCTLSELIMVTPDWAHPFRWWTAMAAMKTDLRGYDIKPTTDAAWLGIAQGIIRYDEVQAGVIDHMIRFCLPNVRRGPAIWPASHSDGTNPSPDAPPMGARMRLKPTVDTSGWSREAKVVAEAMRTHGIVLADTCPTFTIQGEPDARWNDAALASLSTLTASDFEGVDVSPMMISPNTLRVR